MFEKKFLGELIFWMSVICKWNSVIKSDDADIEIF